MPTKPDLFSVYTWELNSGQTIWDKAEVVLGTFWEHDENTLGT